MMGRTPRPANPEDSPMNDTNSTGQPAALPGLAEATGSESAAIAARIPWRFVSHMSGDREHALMHRNEELNLQCETITKYRHGVPGKARRYFYVNEKRSPIFESLPALLDAYPLIRQLAGVTYPPNKNDEP